MLVFIAFVVLLFSMYGESSYTIQIAGVLFFIFAGAAAIFRVRNKGRLFRLDGSTILICLLLPIASCFSLLIDQSIDLIPQTLLFMICGFTARTLILVYGVAKTIRVYIYAAIAMTALTLVFEHATLNESLQFAINEGGGRIRFMPFGNHPNLTGHIFGISFLSCAIYTYWHKKFRNWIWYATLLSAVACIVILGATSSRGTVIATMSALIAIYTAHSLKTALSQKVISSFLFCTLAFPVAIFLDIGNINNYLIELFEINSKYRGVDSGLTGRIDNWPIIFAMSFDSFGGIVIGHGIRSWSVDMYGFATDSSYINLLWESGALLTTAVIILLLRKIYLAGVSDRSFVSDFYLAVLVFAVTESIVARYLLAVGNPGSLLILIVLLTSEKMLLQACGINRNNIKVRP